MTEPLGHRGVSVPFTDWRIHWNMLPREMWYFGRADGWYDGPIPSFGFGVFHVYLIAKGYR